MSETNRKLAAILAALRAWRRSDIADSLFGVRRFAVIPHGEENDRRLLRAVEDSVV